MDGKANLQCPLAWRNTLDAGFDGSIDQCLLGHVANIIVNHNEGEHGINSLKHVHKALLVREVHLHPRGSLDELLRSGILTNISYTRDE